ncbi:MAG: hypothetical protein HQK54_18095 [Oligoflexales bacterium]|nr:hypothetical protein [Oligoflexales bacterium]
MNEQRHEINLDASLIQVRQTPDPDLVVFEGRKFGDKVTYVLYKISEGKVKGQISVGEKDAGYYSLIHQSGVPPVYF